MKFSIEQLKLANELCFPKNFEQLLKKYLPEDDSDMLRYHCRQFVGDYGGNLIKWIFSSTRASDRKYWGEINDKMIADLLTVTPEVQPEQPRFQLVRGDTLVSLNKALLELKDKGWKLVPGSTSMDDEGEYSALMKID